ncbi:MAG TPA: hypothetical protein VNM14_17660 [Planctomycetota bacterium]|jgi:hypothetical protein|nr:hypothetical protein [Planctomycetota bacterium]
MTSGMILCLLMAAQTSPSSMPADSWMAVPNSAMRSVAPTNGQFPGTWGVSGPGMVIAAWGGGAFDAKRGRLVLWGGGHADYYGNELYAFDVATLKWLRLTDPFVNPVMDQEVNGDGTPNSRHTYGGLAYIAHADRFFGQAGSLAGIGFATCNRTWTFDFDAKKWTDRAPATTSGGGFGVNCSYDPATKKVWWCSSGLWSYDYDANAWTKHNADEYYYHSSAMDTKRGQMVIVGNGLVCSYDLKNANYTRQVWTTTGGDALISKGNIGLDYDPTIDRIVGWAGGSPYLLDPATKTWTAGSAVGASPPGQNGIYGRWRYVPSANAFVVVTGFDENVYFYKASAGVGTPAPAPTPSPAPAPSAPVPAPNSSGGSSDGGSDGRCGCGSTAAGAGPESLLLAALSLLAVSRR